MSESRKRAKPAVTIEPRAIDVATTAQVYGLGETTIRELIKHHGFPSLQVGARVIIPVAQADAWLAARANGTPIDLAAS